MGKKLEKNRPGENSRMMQPEYMLRIMGNEREKLRRVKPVLDEQKLEEIECTLALSLRSHVRVNVVIFGPFENTILRGFVTSIHTHSREFKLQWAEDWKWIDVDDVAEAYIV